MLIFSNEKHALIACVNRNYDHISNMYDYQPNLFRNVGDFSVILEDLNGNIQTPKGGVR